MISEGSRDTEVWSMKIAENSALITGINVYSHKQLFKILIIFHNIAVFTVFLI